MPSYKLIYFDLPGLAEPIRLLFSYGKVPFIDQRITKEEWVTLKPTTPFGHLPILEIDGVPYSHSRAIFRYVGSIVGLIGKDPMENLAIDSVLGAMLDIREAIVKLRFCEDEAKKPELKKALEERYQRTYKKLEVDAGKNGGYLALNRPTWTDVLFCYNYELLRNALGIDVLTPYPNLQKVKKTVLSQEGIREYLKKRAPNPMKPKYELQQDL
ncbi:unnamed protein product [Psylliodes chrysocephalus]|uniref:glutathione transferase n=1 Tax=Psylliodes chrysocephalus TaxID=3402493 RepID=A0A9P0CIJ5_9CUCU|nr:unnamed protein product [Psylliodes chrysocephala]